MRHLNSHLARVSQNKNIKQKEEDSELQMSKEIIGGPGKQTILMNTMTKQSMHAEGRVLLSQAQRADALVEVSGARSAQPCCALTSTAFNKLTYARSNFTAQ